MECRQHRPCGPHGMGRCSASACFDKDWWHIAGPCWMKMSRQTGWLRKPAQQGSEQVSYFPPVNNGMMSVQRICCAADFVRTGATFQSTNGESALLGMLTQENAYRIPASTKQCCSFHPIASK